MPRETSTSVKVHRRTGAGETASPWTKMPRTSFPEQGTHSEPRDPLLIPTVLSLTPPAGVTVEEISYPPATDFVQDGQAEPLAVFEHEFTIDVRLAVGADVSPGDVVVPGRLRYQACDDTVCCPPARADVEWRLQVVSG